MADYYVHLTDGSDSGDGSAGTPWLTVPYAFGRSASGDTIQIYGDSPMTVTIVSPGPCVIASDGTVTALEPGIVDSTLAFTAGPGVLDSSGIRYTLEPGIIDESLYFWPGPGVLDGMGMIYPFAPGIIDASPAFTPSDGILSAGTYYPLEPGIVDWTLAFTPGNGILTGGTHFTLEPGIVDASPNFTPGPGVLDSSGTRTTDPCIYENGSAHAHGLLSSTAYQASGVVDANGNAWALDATDSPPFLAGREAAAPGGQFGGGGFF